MKTLTLTVPDNIDLDIHQAAMIVASSLYQQSKLSLGQAAALAGLTKRAFMEALGAYGISIFNHSPLELENDVANA